MENDQIVLPEGQKREGRSSLVGAILGLVLIGVSVFCALLGGLKAETGLGKDIGVFEFFNFSKGSVWDFLITVIKNKEDSPSLGLFLQYAFGAITVAVMFILLLIMLIRGIVKFGKSVKTGDYGKFYGSAFGAYAAFLGGQIALLSLFSINTNGSDFIGGFLVGGFRGELLGGESAAIPNTIPFMTDYSLNSAAVAGAVIGGILIVGMVLLRLLPSAKQAFGNGKKIAHYILTLLTAACVVALLVFAARPLIVKIGEGEMGMEMSCLQNLNMLGIAAEHLDFQVFFAGTVGPILIFLMILFCLIQLVRNLKQLSAPSIETESFRKSVLYGGLIFDIGIFAALIPFAFWNMLKDNIKFGATAQIVILALALANFILMIVDYFVLKDKPKKQ